MATANGKRSSKVDTGTVTVDGTLTFTGELSGWYFSMVGGTATIDADVLSNTLTLATTFTSSVNLPEGCEEHNPTFTITVTAGTLYYTLVGKESITVAGERGTDVQL